MKAREILAFVLSGRVNIEQCAIIETVKGENFAEHLGDLCDDCDCGDGEYFVFWSSDYDYKLDRMNLLKNCEKKIIDYELPTKDGWWIVVKIEN